MRIAVLTLCLLGSLAGTLFADELVLKDGRYIQVEVLGADENRIHVRLLESGGELWIPWSLLRDEDRDRFMVQFGFKEADRQELTRPGLRLITTSGEEFLGVPKTEFDVQSLPDPLVLIHQGRELPFARNIIRSVEVTEVPALEAYSRPQVYEQELARVAPAEDDIEAQLQMAQLAADIDYYEKAVLHTLAARRIDPEYRPSFISNQLERLEALARNQRIVDAIRSAKREAYVKRFDEARTQLSVILAVEDIEPNLKAQAQLALEDVQRRRWVHFSREVALNYFRVLERKLTEVARSEKMKLQEAQNFVTRELHKEIIGDLAKTFGLDPKEEVQKMWDERKKLAQRSATYGSGTFVISGKAPGVDQRMQAMQRALARQMQEQQRGGGRNNQAVAPIQLPKLPSKDDWWKSADTLTKTQFLKSLFAEKGKSLEVVGERQSQCLKCGATGTVTWSGAQDQSIEITCPRCQGHRYDRGVAFR